MNHILRGIKDKGDNQGIINNKRTSKISKKPIYEKPSTGDTLRKTNCSKRPMILLDDSTLSAQEKTTNLRDDSITQSQEETN